MAILAQPTLHIIASASNNTLGAIVRERWQPGRTETTKRGGTVNYGGGCTGEIGFRLGALSASFHELPLLQLHVRAGGLPGSKFLSSCGQVVTKWHWIGDLGVNRRPPRKRRASRGDDRESSSEEGTNDTDKATLEEQNDTKTNGEEQGADSQESGGEIGEVSREEAEGESSREDEADRNETSLQNEGSKTGFWRKIWEPRQKDDDNTLGAEEELLLQDLESLRFDWKGLLDPTRENLLALGFTALLTLALLKIFSQLVLVVITIVLSALKYTVLAVVLLGLLIFLL